MAFGRLERTPGQTPMSEINVTPLVDVMLVLLVIFIITAPLMVSSMKLDLPKTDGVQASAPQRAIELAVDAKGVIYLDAHGMTLDQLSRSLHERAAQALAAGAQELPEVQLRADAAVPHGRVVEVMGAAQQAGLTRMGFVAEPKSKALGAGGPPGKP